MLIFSTGSIRCQSFYPRLSAKMPQKRRVVSLRYFGYRIAIYIDERAISRAGCVDPGWLRCRDRALFNLLYFLPGMPRAAPVAKRGLFIAALPTAAESSLRLLA